ncbi:MAG: hypothetical protein O3A51_13140 [Verrucomicrobia bacterium]|nr:hypothetical protein [Verrucomicrobiota bacterium]
MIEGLFIAGAAQQMARANRAQLAGERASRVASDVRTQNEGIQFDIEKLFMITEALWTLLKEQNGYTDEQLVQMIQDIDLRDGKLDGKVAKSAERPTCTGCGRTLIRRQAKCLYCGAVTAQQPFER